MRASSLLAFRCYFELPSINKDFTSLHLIICVALVVATNCKCELKLPLTHSKVNDHNERKIPFFITLKDLAIS